MREELLESVRTGVTPFADFVRETRGDWMSMAWYAIRRVGCASWLDVADVEQEALAGAARALRDYDASRGMPLHRYVTWCALVAAKRACLASRLGHRPHRGAPRGALLLREVPMPEHCDAITFPTQGDAIERADALRGLTETTAGALTVRALARAGCVDGAARLLYGHYDARRICRLGSEGAARRLVARMVRIMARRASAAF